MQNNMYSGIGQNPEEDAFQRRLVGLMTPREPGWRGGSYDYGTREYLGPNTRMLAYSHSSPENTNIIGYSPTGWNIQGMYSRRSNRSMSTLSPQMAQRAQIFPNFNPNPGAINSADNNKTVSHEMLHRLQDLKPRVFDGEDLEELDRILASVGRDGYSNSHLLNIRSRANELLPHGLSGFSQTPADILERYGIDREKLRERVGGERRRDRVARQLRDLIERVYTRTIGAADYEHASRRLEPPVTRGRGRPAYE